MQAARSPAVPALSGAVDVGIAWMIADSARRSAGRAQSTIEAARPAPCASVVRSSQISFFGLA
jgi:hypothetical protein